MAARDALPVLNPGTPVLMRSDRRIHVGSDPRTALIVDVAPTVAAATLVTVLQRLRSPQRYRSVRRDIRSAGMTATAFWRLVDSLVEAGKAAPPPETGTRPFDVGVIGHGEMAHQLLTGLPLAGHRARPVDHRDLWRDAGARPQLVVIADQPVPDPTVLSTLMTLRIPHLAAFVDDGSGSIGPLVLPGLSSCLRCVDLYRADADPQWPVLAATLQGVAGSADRATCQGTAALAEAQVTEIATRVLTRSSDAPSSIGRILRFRSSPGTLTAVTAPAHPRCRCLPSAGPDGPGAAPPERSSTILGEAAKGLS